jgi:hypothetical protein
VQFSQLGVRTPVAIAYAPAPAIFLLLHVHTLIRFDMLAANLRLLAVEPTPCRWRRIGSGPARCSPTSSSCSF